MSAAFGRAGHHTGRWLLAGLGCLVLATVAVVSFAILSYQPLQAGGAGGGGGYQGGNGLVSLRSGLGDAYQLSSGPFQGKLGISLVNTGRWGVTIESVSGPPVLGNPRDTACLQGTNMENYTSSRCVPFHPFELSAAGKPGDWQFLFLTLHFPCVPLAENQSIVIDSYQVTYRYLGFDHTITLDHLPLTLSGPNHC